MIGPAVALGYVDRPSRRAACPLTKVTSLSEPPDRLLIVNPGDPRATLERLAASAGREDRLTHLEVVPPRVADFSHWPDWVHAGVLTALERRGIARPWAHQTEAAQLAFAGQHVVVATGTASGKSLAFQLPALTTILNERGRQGQRGAGVLYLSPTKALAHDQALSLRGLETGVRISTHDGDSTQEEREWTRDHSEYILTNPDMLHRSLLPTHQRWSSFFKSLRFVVIDECHHYRGVFGAHVSAIIRRLRRVCAAYGAHPTFILASATAADPDLTAQRLIGLPTVAVTSDGSPRGQLALALWEPPLTDLKGENDAPVRRPSGAEMADILADLVIDGVHTLAFVRSRQGAERVALGTKQHLAQVDPALANKVAAYRGGYLPEERRALEAALRDGSLVGLAATNALELGIDISGLDAVLIGGFPGTRAAMWQQFGRAGRGHGNALGVFVARDDPLDTYLVHHPEALLEAPVEAAVFDPENPYVVGPHLCTAAAEIPLTTADFDVFGAQTPALVDDLVEQGLLRKRPQGWFWTDRARASDLADIRSTGGAPVRLVETDTGRLLGTVDASSAHSSVHTGAIYLHQGETFVVEQLDLADDVAFITRAEVDYSTTARQITDIAVIGESQHQVWSSIRLAYGEVQVTHQVTSYLKKSRRGEVLAEHPLDLPPRSLQTKAIWWTVPEHALDGFEHDLPGSAHAAEHAAIGLLPLFATCDRWDIGGVSTAMHPDTGILTVFVYDGHPGGAGFAERGFHTAQSWLRATLAAISECECDEGCPSCVQSPKCGNGNSPLDKAGAIELLKIVVANAPQQQS